MSFNIFFFLVIKHPVILLYPLYTLPNEHFIFFFVINETSSFTQRAAKIIIGSRVYVFATLWLYLVAPNSFKERNANLCSSKGIHTLVICILFVLLSCVYAQDNIHFRCNKVHPLLQDVIVCTRLSNKYKCVI